MANLIKIAVDCMGGDDDATFVFPGLNRTLNNNNNLSFLLFGDRDIIEKRLSNYKDLANSSEIFHTEYHVKMDDKPSHAIKNGKSVSGMWQAIECVRDDRADFVISAGNTGALMAMSTLILKTISKIQRPAIAALWPTVNGETVVLDIGATIGFDRRQLIDFSILGASMAQTIFDVERPTLSLLNIGEEEIKGLDEIKAAHEILKNGDNFFKYKGFVEGNKIGFGFSDVIVTDGFTGNIALKTAEGTAKQISQYLKETLNGSILSKIGYLLAKQSFQTLREKMNPNTLNGGVFLGLNGIVIKSHGKTDHVGFSSALDLGIDMHRSGLIDKIVNNIELTEKELLGD